MAINRVKVTRAAEKFIRQNRLDDAIRQYRRLLDDNPGDVLTLNKVGDLYRKMGQEQRALTCYRRIAEHYRDRGFAPKAIAMYKKVAKLDAGDVNSREELARLYADAGLNRDAVQNLREAADLLASGGDGERAMELESRALELCPHDWSGLKSQARKLQAAGETERAVTTYLRAADGMACGGKLEDAIACCEEAVRIVPCDPGPIAYLVRLLNRHDQPQESMTRLRRLMAEEPAPHLHALLGESLLLAGHATEARQALETAAGSDFADRDLGCRLALLRLNLSEGRAAEVERSLSAVVDLMREAANDEGALELLQEVLGAHGDMSAAHECLLAVCRQSSAAPERREAALRQLVSVLESAPAHEQALQEAMALLNGFSSHGGDAGTHRGGAAGVSHAAPLAEGDEQYTRMEGDDGSEVDPDFVSEHLVEADVFVKYGLHAKAAAHLAKVIERYPRTLVAHQRIVELYSETGQAEATVIQSVQLAEVYRLRGALEEAREVLARAQEKQPDNPSLAAMLEELSPSAPLPAYRPTYQRALGTVPAGQGDDPRLSATPPGAPALAAPPTKETEPAAAPALQPDEEVLEINLDVEPGESPTPAVGSAGQAAAVAVQADPADNLDFFDLAEAIERELASEDPRPPASPVVDDGEGGVDPVMGIHQAIQEQVESEDHQTHYQLGIAFKEMGLLDEAIGQFQQASRDADAFLGCCSMLGLCFREKGMPQIAEKWYRKALDQAAASGRQDEELLGLLYDLGTLHQEQGRSDEARHCFTEIYASDASYRDVVSRLRVLSPDADDLSTAEC